MIISKYKIIGKLHMLCQHINIYGFVVDLVASLK
jgi:hypothetical protein